MATKSMFQSLHPGTEMLIIFLTFDLYLKSNQRKDPDVDEMANSDQEMDSKNWLRSGLSFVALALALAAVAES